MIEREVSLYVDSLVYCIYFMMLHAAIHLLLTKSQVSCSFPVSKSASSLDYCNLYYLEVYKFSNLGTASEIFLDTRLRAIMTAVKGFCALCLYSLFSLS